MAFSPPFKVKTPLLTIELSVSCKSFALAVILPVFLILPVKIAPELFTKVVPELFISFAVIFFLFWVTPDKLTIPFVASVFWIILSFIPPVKLRVPSFVIVPLKLFAADDNVPSFEIEVAFIKALFVTLPEEVISTLS